MILVTGASGQLGQATIATLLENNVPATDITALVRHPEKAVELKEKGIAVKYGDYTNISTLEAAFKGIDKVFFISSSGLLEDRWLQHKNVIDTAVKLKIPQLVYTGFEMKNLANSSIPHITQVHAMTIAYLAQQPLTHTILNNTLYADLIPAFIGELGPDKDILFPAGKGKVPFLPRLEMAKVAAEILSNETYAQSNNHFSIASDKSYDFADIAAILSELSAEKRQYAPDKDAYIQQQTTTSGSEQNAQFLAGFGTAISRGEFETQKSDFEKIMDRRAMDLKQFLSQL